MTPAGDDTPTRVRITSQRAAAKRRTPRTAALEIDTQSEIGNIYLRSLLRAQLRLAAGVLGAVTILVGGLPLAFWLWPGVWESSLFGMPVSWVLLGFAIYPLLFVLGWVFVRGAERNERAFSDVVEDP